MRISRKLTFAFLLSASLTAAGLLVLPAFAGGEAKVEGWRIEQRSFMEGPVTLLISSKGARIEIRRQALVCVSKAPDWKPHLFNTNSKLHYTCDNKCWQGYSPHLPIDRATLGSATISHEFWQGLSVIRESRPVLSCDPIKEQYEMIFRDSEGRAVVFNREDIIYCNFFKPSKEQFDFIRPLYRYKSMPNIPLACDHLYPHGKIDHTLTTSSAKKTMIDPSEFCVPPNYTLTRDRDEVLLDRAKRKMLPGVVEDMFGISK